MRRSFAKKKVATLLLLSTNFAMHLYPMGKFVFLATLRGSICLLGIIGFALVRFIQVKANVAILPPSTALVRVRTS